MGESSLEIRPPERVGEKRLDSWKEIASYLNRDVTTSSAGRSVRGCRSTGTCTTSGALCMP